MKNILFLSKICFFLLLFISCSSRKDKKETSSGIPVTQKSGEKILIKLAGSLWFTKSYSFIQSSLLSDKEKDRLFKETSNRNPLISLDPGNDTFFRKKFEELNIVAGNELLLNKIKLNTDPDFFLTISNEKEIKIQIERDTITGKNTKIVVFSKKSSSETEASIYSHLKYLILDIIPGGYEEIVILNDHYLSNTKLYYLDVYEIKSSG